MIIVLVDVAFPPFVFPLLPYLIFFLILFKQLCANFYRQCLQQHFELEFYHHQCDLIAPSQTNRSRFVFYTTKLALCILLF